VGVIGAWGRGSLAVNWHQPRGRSIVVAGADVSEKSLEEFRRHINKDAFTTRDYRELLKRKDVDAVAITSPDWTHEKYAVAALRAGKHVYCEKPLAITIKGCDHILLEAKKTGKKLMIGFNMRYMNFFQKMRELIRQGVIGDVKAVWVRHFVGMGGTFYYHDWHANRRYSTGLLLQKGSHDIDMIHWLAGKYSVRVSAFGGLDYYGGSKPDNLRCRRCRLRKTCWEYDGPNRLCCFRKEVNVEDNNAVIMELEGGIKAAYLQCHFTPEYWRNYTVIGTEGRIENMYDNAIMVKFRDGAKKFRKRSDTVIKLKEVKGDHAGADPDICADFVDYVLSGKKPLTSPVAGRQSVAVGCLATESIRSGGKILKIPSLPKGIKE